MFKEFDDCFTERYNADVGSMTTGNLLSAFERGIIKRFPADKARPINKRTSGRPAKNKPFDMFIVAECVDGNAYILDGYKRIVSARERDVDPNEVNILAVKRGVTLADMLTYLSYDTDVCKTADGFVNSVCDLAIFKEPILGYGRMSEKDCRSIALSLLSAAAGMKSSATDVKDVADMEASQEPEFRILDDAAENAALMLHVIAEGLAGCTPPALRGGRNVHYIKLIIRLLAEGVCDSRDITRLTEYLFGTRWVRKIALNKRNDTNNLELFRLILMAKPWNVADQDVQIFRHNHNYKGIETELSDGRVELIPLKEFSPLGIDVLTALAANRPLARKVAGRMFTIV